MPASYLHTKNRPTPGEERPLSSLIEVCKQGCENPDLVLLLTEGYGAFVCVLHRSRKDDNGVVCETEE